MKNGRKTARKEKTPRRRNGAKLDSNGRRDRASSVRGLHQPKTQLESAIERYVDLYEFAPIAYISFDRAGRIEEANLVASELLSESRDLLIGRPFAFYVTDLDSLLKHLLLCRTSQQEVTTELLLKDKKGQQIPAVLLSTPITSTTKNGALLYQTAIIDLRELKAAEAKLQTSEQRYKTLFDLVPVAVYACNADGVITEFNRRAVELWGREPQRNGSEPGFCGSYKIYHPDGRPMPHEHCPMARVLRGEKLKQEELEIVLERPDGERRHVIAAPQIAKDERGKILGAINCLYDFTERKHAEADAVRLAAVVQSSHDAIVGKTVKGIITDWNQGAERIFGYKPKEIIGKSILTLIPRDRHAEETEILRRIRGGQSVNHYETIRRRKDGRLIDVSLTISPIKDRKGKIIGVSKIARDITAQKKAEQRLAEQARLLDLSTDAIIVRDAKDHVTYWNKGATKIYGYTREEALGKVIRDLLKSEYPEPLPKIHEKLLRDNQWEGEILHTRRDGRRLIVFSRWALDRDAQGNRAYILETNNDITQRKRAEQRQTVNLAVTKILAESPALTYAVMRILQNVCETLGWEAGAFWTHDPQAGVLRCLTGWECHHGRFRKFKKISSELTLARGVGLPGLVWSSRKPRWISDYANTDFPRARVAIADGLHAAFAVPISYRKRFLAVMECFSCEIRGPDEDLLKVFASIGSQIGQFIQRKESEAALQKSKELLEQRVRQRTRELRAANKMMKDEIARRKGLEGEILEISDREQQRLGQELHDGLCQHLTAVAFMARSVALRLRNHRVIDAGDIEKIANLVNDAAADTRNLSRALHRIDVDAAGLVDALRDLVDREIWKIPCRLLVRPSFHIEDNAAALQLYRIAREAVINANKHAQAREIVIKLERAPQGMVLRVIDDGVGVPVESKLKQGLGFHIMTYRAKLIGGHLKIERAKKGGTSVSCYFPDNTPDSNKPVTKENGRQKGSPTRIGKVLAVSI
jgi:PAS domain S-box-containing protein